MPAGPVLLVLALAGGALVTHHAAQRSWLRRGPPAWAPGQANTPELAAPARLRPPRTATPGVAEPATPALARRLVDANVSDNLTVNSTAANATTNATTNVTANATTNVTTNVTANLTTNATTNATANSTGNGTANGTVADPSTTGAGSVASTTTVLSAVAPNTTVTSTAPPATISTTTSSTSATTTTTTRPSDWFEWLHIDDDAFYVNLPATDNWSKSGALNTSWSKIRLMHTPQIGNTTVTLNLHDWTYSESNDLRSSGFNLWRVAWGVTGGCNNVSNQFSINLAGTPFRFEATYMEAGGSEEWGGVTCSSNGRQCSGTCGGYCGFCGFGQPNRTVTATLVVANQTLFDEAVWAVTTVTSTETATTTVTATTTDTSDTETTRTSTASTTTTSTVTTTTTTTPAPDAAAGSSSSSPVGWVLGLLFGTLACCAAALYGVRYVHGRRNYRDLEGGGMQQVPPARFGSTY